MKFSSVILGIIFLSFCVISFGMDSPKNPLRKAKSAKELRRKKYDKLIHRKTRSFNELFDYKKYFCEDKPELSEL